MRHDNEQSFFKYWSRMGHVRYTTKPKIFRLNAHFLINVCNGKTQCMNVSRKVRVLDTFLIFTCYFYGGVESAKCNQESIRKKLRLTDREIGVNIQHSGVISQITRTECGHHSKTKTRQTSTFKAKCSTGQLNRQAHQQKKVFVRRLRQKSDT